MRREILDRAPAGIQPAISLNRVFSDLAETQLVLPISSGHPGGLCRMAIPYDLIHILIDKGIAEPGDWWYASPYYISQEGKISAQRP